MKYVVDVDALKECLDLINKPYSVRGRDCVYLDTVKEMIDRFPKDSVTGEVEIDG